MKIKLNNIGPIECFELDLSNNLIVIFGKNNIGKSYAMSTTYLILKYLMQNDYFDFRYIMNRVINSDLEKLEENLKATQSVQTHIDITADFEKIFTKILRITFLEGFNESLSSSFGGIESIKSKFSNQDSTIEIIGKEIQITLKIIENQLVIDRINLNFSLIVKHAQKHWSIKYNDNETIIHFNAGGTQFFDDLSSVLEKCILDITNNQLESVSLNFLPASRSGLYQALNAFSQIIAELSKRRTFLRKSINLPQIQEPLSDYFIKLSDINIKSKKSDKYTEIVKLLENELLKGEISFDDKSRNIRYSPHNTDLKIDVSLSSSMVSEISPIVAYFKYIVSETLFRPRKQTEYHPIIFIEEPESHLHPYAQIIITEILVKAVKLGCKIIMTSHSSYVFNKLNNLIISKEINYSECANYILEKEESKGSIARNIKSDELGFDDLNFGIVSESLYNEKIDVIRKLNALK